MVGSVMPFLGVLADNTRIWEVPILAKAYEVGGFQTSYSFLVSLGVISLIVIGVANLIQILRTWAVARFALMRMHTLSYKLLEKYLRQPYENYASSNTGDLSSKMLAESQEVVNRFYRPAGEVVASTFSALAILAFLLWVNTLVALLALITLGAIYVIALALTRSLISQQGRVRAEVNKARFRLASEALGGIKDIKLLGREDMYIDRYKIPSERMSKANIVVQVLGEIPQYVMQFVGFGGIISLCLLLLTPSSLSDGTALGGILPLIGVFAFAGQRLIPELSRLYRGLSQLSYGAAAVEAVHRDLTSRNRYDEPSNASAKPLGLKKHLELKSFGYKFPGSEYVGLHETNLKINAGSKIGVVGSTGSGKTTLANSVLGLLLPTTGRMFVDGNQITYENIRSWRQTVGYVPQDIFLADASIAENIALGLPSEEIDYFQMRRAAAIAQLSKFVEEELPQGYDTIVGERGARLSGGQRQRIGIARALYHDADLIVFDEATSALDNITEAEVVSAIDKLPGEKTILMIAHRLSTVRECDQIIVLDRGRVAGFSTWDDLLDRVPAFKRLVSAEN